MKPQTLGQLITRLETQGLTLEQAMEYELRMAVHDYYGNPTIVAASEDYPALFAPRPGVEEVGSITLRASAGVMAFRKVTP